MERRKAKRKARISWAHEQPGRVVRPVVVSKRTQQYKKMRQADKNDNVLIAKAGSKRRRAHIMKGIE